MLSLQVKVKALKPCRANKISYPIGALFHLEEEHALRAEASGAVVIIKNMQHKDITDYTVKDAIPLIDSSTDAATLKEWQDKEKAGLARKTILTAIKVQLDKIEGDTGG